MRCTWTLLLSTDICFVAVVVNVASAFVDIAPGAANSEVFDNGPCTSILSFGSIFSQTHL